MLCGASGPTPRALPGFSLASLGEPMKDLASAFDMFPQHGLWKTTAPGWPQLSALRGRPR